MDKLSQRVQDLPPELFNQIYTETFQTDLQECSIDDSYKPPQLLQVNQASRSLFAQSYYGRTTFIFDKRAICYRWTKSLPDEHCLLLRTIRTVQELDAYLQHAFHHRSEFASDRPRFVRAVIHRAIMNYFPPPLADPYLVTRYSPERRAHIKVHLGCLGLQDLLIITDNDGKGT